MNLAGVLSPRSSISILSCSAFFLISVFVPKLTSQTPEQTSFGAEDEKFDQAVTLSRAAKEALAKEQSIADLLRDQKLSPEQTPDKWFMAAQVHLSSPTENDLVVMGDRIGRGAYTAAFWVLRKSEKGYRVVLRDNAQALDLLDGRTNGMRDISLAITNLRGASTRDFRFDGSIYKIAKRTFRPILPDVQRDLSKYETHKPFIQLLGQDEEPILAEARAWIWRHWQAHVRSYVEVSTQDADGEKRHCAFFVDDASETHEWQVAIEIHQTVWDQDSPAGPRYFVIEDKLEIASQVQRTLPAEDDSQPSHVLADNEVPASKFKLNFLDGDYSVFVL